MWYNLKKGLLLGLRMIAWAVAFYLAMEGLIEILGIRNSTPSVGAVLGTFLSTIQYPFMERAVVRAIKEHR